MSSSPQTAPTDASRAPLLLDVALASALFAAALATYVRTLAPGLLLNDSAELQTLAYTVGHTHPTGYPVYVLAAKLMTWLPAGSVAWRVNLFSALCGAATAAGVFALLRLLTGRRWLPALAAMQLAISPTFWSQAIIAEVYVPAAAVTCGVLLLLVVWRRTGSGTCLFAAAAFGGLSLGVHLTVALLAPAAALFVATERRGWLRNAALAAAGALTGAALTLLAFYVVDRNRPPSDYFRAVVEPSRSAWGLEADEIDDFSERLRFSLSAVQYRDNLRRRSLDDLRSQASDYLRNLPRELPWLWLAAAAIGAARLLRRHFRFAVLVLLTFAAHVAYLARHDMGDIQVAYIPTYLLLTILAGCCAGVRRPAPTDGAGVGQFVSRRPSRLFEAALIAVLLPATLVPLFRDDAWTREGRRAAWVPAGEPPFVVEESGRLHAALGPLVAELEPNAIVFCEWSHLYVFYYIAHVEQQRTDLMFLQAYPAIGQRRLADSARTLIRKELAGRPIYAAERMPELSDEFEFEAVERGGRTLFRVIERREH